MKKSKTGSATPHTPLSYDISLIAQLRFCQYLPEKEFDATRKNFLRYDITPELGFDADTVGFILRLSGTIAETGEKLLECDYMFEFHVPGLKHRTITRKKSLIWAFRDQRDNGLMSVLMAVSYSTFRGIVLERVKGTVMEGTYLPILDPVQLVKGMQHQIHD